MADTSVPSPLSTQLLSEAATEHEEEPPRDLVRRLAASHGPSPIATLRVFIVVIGCTYFAEYHEKYLQGQSSGLPISPAGLEAFYGLSVWSRLLFLSLVALALLIGVVSFGQWMVCQLFVKAVASSGVAVLDFHSLRFNALTSRFTATRVFVHRILGNEQGYSLEAKNVSFTIDGTLPLLTMMVRGCDTMNTIKELRLETVDTVDDEHVHYAPKPSVQSLLEKMKADLPLVKQHNELVNSLLNCVALAARVSGKAQASDLDPPPSLQA